MKINYDKIADAVYFYVKKGKIFKTRPINENVNIDVDKNGNTVGIELLNASSKKGLEFRRKIEKGIIPAEFINKAPIIA